MGQCPNITQTHGTANISTGLPLWGSLLYCPSPSSWAPIVGQPAVLSLTFLLGSRRGAVCCTVLHPPPFYASVHLMKNKTAYREAKKTATKELHRYNTAMLCEFLSFFGRQWVAPGYPRILQDGQQDSTHFTLEGSWHAVMEDHMSLCVRDQPGQQS